MKKRKTSRRTSRGTNSKKASSLTSVALVAGEAMVGMVIGSQIKKFVEKKDVVSGTDLLGLDGATSKFTSPLIATAAGVAAIMLSKNQHIANIGFGAALAGGVGLVNAAAGKSIVALGAAEDEDVTVGASPQLPALPGIGAWDTAVRDVPGIPTSFEASIDPSLTQQPVSGVGYANIL
ncbi:MAG: hypothetical protein LBU90_10240 [Bacteroidales bacterium]|jgi:hypothetical protein|nr:hypothetical protein [Bacteroidales bacterium]